MKTAWYTTLMDLAGKHGDLTQQDVAKKLGVSPAAVTYWKEGRLPAAQTVLAAAEAYNADALTLLSITFLDDCPPEVDPL